MDSLDKLTGSNVNTIISALYHEYMACAEIPVKEREEHIIEHMTEVLTLAKRIEGFYCLNIVGTFTLSRD